MAIRKMSSSNLKGNSKTTTRTIKSQVIEEPQVDEIEEEMFEEEIEEVVEDEFEEEVENEEEIEEEEVEEEIEEVVEEKPKAKTVKKSETKKAAPKTTKAKATPKKEKVSAPKGKSLVSQPKQQSSNPKEVVQEGKITKRDDIFKIAMEELQEKGYSMTLEAMNIVYKAIENAMEYSLSNGAPVFFMGNQITPKEAPIRFSQVPNQDYWTMTMPRIVYQWRKLTEAEVIRGEYNKDKKEFKAEDGTVYDCK